MSLVTIKGIIRHVYPFKIIAHTTKLMFVAHIWPVSYIRIFFSMSLLDLYLSNYEPQMFFLLSIVKQHRLDKCRNIVMMYLKVSPDLV